MPGPWICALGNEVIASLLEAPLGISLALQIVMPSHGPQRKRFLVLRSNKPIHMRRIGRSELVIKLNA